MAISIGHRPLIFEAGAEQAESGTVLSVSGLDPFVFVHNWGEELILSKK